MSGWLWALVVVVGGVLLGLGIAFVATLADKREVADPADVRAARALLDLTDEQAQRDAAYAAAEEQAAARAELGLGWEMPSREQIEAAASDGRHDRFDEVTETDRALLAAALEAAYVHQERPRITAERTDTDGTTHRW